MGFYLLNPNQNPKQNKLNPLLQTQTNIITHNLNHNPKPNKISKSTKIIKPQLWSKSQN